MKPVKTETRVRQFDDDGNVISETTTVVEVTKSAEDVDESDDLTGMYL